MIHDYRKTVLIVGEWEISRRSDIFCENRRDQGRFHKFLFCENNAISRLLCYYAAKLSEMRARAVFECDSFVFLQI